LPLPLVPSPPFDLRPAKCRRISAESAPGLTPIGLVSQLFDKTRPLGRSTRRPHRVPSQLTSSSPSPARSSWNERALHRSSTRRPGSGHRANHADRTRCEMPARRSARKRPLATGRRRAPEHEPLAGRRPHAKTSRRCLRARAGWGARAPMKKSETSRRAKGPEQTRAFERALQPSPAMGRSNSERRCLHRKRGRTVSQGRLLIVELWASQAPGSHGSQLGRTAC
jgi:hypothetical protein